MAYDKSSLDLSAGLAALHCTRQRLFEFNCMLPSPTGFGTQAETRIMTRYPHRAWALAWWLKA